MLQLAHFRRTACVDWLDVRLQIARPTQFQHVQTALKEISGYRLYVAPVFPKAGNVSDKFVVRINDSLANDYAALETIFLGSMQRIPLARPPRISAIEIACDFLHKGEVSFREPRTGALTHRLQSSLLAAGGRPRQFDPRLRVNRFMDVAGMRLDPDMNYRIGNKQDDISWQIYWKRTDSGQLLPRERWRARVEVTLQGRILESLGLIELSDLQGYRFTRLARFFRFRTPIPPEIQAGGDLFKLNAIIANRRLNDATPARGLHSFSAVGRRDRWRKVRRESSHLQADNELQDAIKGALRHLKL